MRLTRSELKNLIIKELGSVVTGREKGMSISSAPPAGMTGLKVGDVVYLTPDAYMDADIHRYDRDFPPVTVTEVGNVEDLHGTTIPGQGDPPSDWDWVAGATGPGFVGEYEVAPGLGKEDLVFPMSAIDWEYTNRGPKDPWLEDLSDKGTYAGGPVTSSPQREGKIKVTKTQLRKIIREAIIDEAGYPGWRGAGSATRDYGHRPSRYKYNVGDTIRYRTNAGRERVVKVLYRITPYKAQEDLGKGIEWEEEGIKNGKPGFVGTIVSGKEEEVGQEFWGYDADVLSGYDAKAI